MIEKKIGWKNRWPKNVWSKNMFSIKNIFLPKTFRSTIFSTIFFFDQLFFWKMFFFGKKKTKKLQLQVNWSPRQIIFVAPFFFVRQAEYLVFME